MLNSSFNQFTINYHSIHNIYKSFVCKKTAFFNTSMSTAPKPYVIDFEGQELKNFLSCPNAHRFKRDEVKFNDDFSCIIEFYPNGLSPTETEFIELAIIAKMAKDMEYCSILFETSLINTKLIRANETRFCKIGSKQNNKIFAKTQHFKVSDCKKEKILSFSFILHGLQMKKAGDDDIYCEPSCEQNGLKQISTFKLKFTEKDFDTQYSASSGTICKLFEEDNWKMTLDQHMIIPSGKNGVFLHFELLFWPSRISKMNVMFEVDIINEQKQLDDDCKESEISLEFEKILSLNKEGVISKANMEIKDVEWNDIKDNIRFEGKITIQNLYDLNGNNIDVEQWRIHHHVATLRPQNKKDDHLIKQKK